MITAVIMLVGLLIGSSGNTSENVTKEKEINGSYEISKFIGRTLELKDQNRIQGRDTRNSLLPLALSGETVQKIFVTYNLDNECKIILKRQSFAIEFHYPRKGKCLDLYKDL